MKLIVFRNRSARPVQLAASPLKFAGGLLGAVLVIACIAGTIGFFVGGHYAPDQRAARAELAALSFQLSEQHGDLAALKADTDDHLNALTLQLGDLQARSTRIEALGERLAQVGQLEDGEFNFRATPALGGPVELESVQTMGYQPIDQALAELDQRLALRQAELGVLGDLLANGRVEETLKPTGRPVKSGWLSSGCCSRIDPFTGKKSRHMGIDFSGQPGSEVIAVASGVVTWSGPREQYGNTVDIDHGNGYVTRYAHNQENKVTVGDQVGAGDTIALMGSTGRSTAPHVHFEVIKAGLRIDPTRFVRNVR